MNRRSILSVCATIALGLALFGITAGSTARAAEIKLLCAVALQRAMVALIPDFEKSSGHKVTIAYGTAGAVADRVQKGEAADIVISSNMTESEIATESVGRSSFPVRIV
jgi:molybdate transport system substrate-binding protein